MRTNDLLHILGGYRNRLVHFYHEVSADELFDLCAEKLGALERIATAYRDWLQANSEQMDEKL